MRKDEMTMSAQHLTTAFDDSGTTRVIKTLKGDF
jgi:hypothetical protein